MSNENLKRTTSSNSFVPPTFSFAFLHPRFWLTWLTITFLYLLSWLPYRAQIGMGKLIGRLLLKVLKSRKKTAARNLQLCFPDKPEEEVNRLVKANFENAGIAIFESGISWWWPNWRLKNMCHVKGAEHVDRARQQGKGIFLLFTHIFPIRNDGSSIR